MSEFAAVLTPCRKPSLHELGTDLLHVSWLERSASLVLPFLLPIAFVILASLELWMPALVCAMVQSFFTYGSVSHDLVHRTLKLPVWANEWLLSLIELLNFRSGLAYRTSHLHHHARFPSPDDPEARCAGRSWWTALVDGLTAQPRLWWWSVKRTRGGARRRIMLEGIAVLLLLAACLACWPLSVIPAAYALLSIAGSWIIPLVTSYIPHRPAERDVLAQTRLFRGWIFRLIALDHLYHLEHHLYPQVSHHRWSRLARRLDPFFAAHGVRPIVVWQ